MVSRFADLLKLKGICPRKRELREHSYISIITGSEGVAIYFMGIGDSDKQEEREYL